jgi:hypothetical protein
LAVLAAFLYFSAKQEVARLDRGSHDEEYMGFEFSSGYSHDSAGQPVGQFDAPASKPPSLLAMWKKNRQLLKEQRRREREVSDESRVDEILARLHESGIDSLPPEDRAILQRVSARYRSRLES